MNPDNVLAVRQAIAQRFLLESQPELRTIFIELKLVQRLKEIEGDPREIARHTEIITSLWNDILGPLEGLP